MPFVVPQMPLVVNIWRNGNPTANPPDVITVGNLTPGKRVTSPPSGTKAIPGPQLLMMVLLPPRTDVRGNEAVGGPDTVEIPGGTSRFYEVQTVDDIGRGFANEHRFATLLASGTWPSPVP